MATSDTMPRLSPAAVRGGGGGGSSAVVVSTLPRSVSTPIRTGPLQLSATEPTRQLLPDSSWRAALRAASTPTPSPTGLATLRRRTGRGGAGGTSSPTVALSVARDGIQYSVEVGREQVHALGERSPSGVILLDHGLGSGGVAGAGGDDDHDHDPHKHLNRDARSAALSRENRRLRGALRRTRSQPTARDVLRSYRPTTPGGAEGAGSGTHPGSSAQRRRQRQQQQQQQQQAVAMDRMVNLGRAWSADTAGFELLGAVKPLQGADAAAMACVAARRCGNLVRASEPASGRPRSPPPLGWRSNV
jgi:hypothetical protein